jgi:hypothetical protein
MVRSAIRRRRPGVIDHTPEDRGSVSSVHAEQTTASAVARVQRHLPPEDVEGLLQRRFQIVNLWRPIHHPPCRARLAARALRLQQCRSQPRPRPAHAKIPRSRWGDIRRAVEREP